MKEHNLYIDTLTEKAIRIFHKYMETESPDFEYRVLDVYFGKTSFMCVCDNGKTVVTLPNKYLFNNASSAIIQVAHRSLSHWSDMTELEREGMLSKEKALYAIMDITNGELK